MVANNQAPLRWNWRSTLNVTDRSNREKSYKRNDWI
jgi:hypothetical protein